MKKVGRIAGILFLLALIPYVIAQMLILEEMLYIPDYLQALRTGRARVGIALTMKYLSLTAMLGFSILIFPILKKQQTELALGYVGLRFLEFGILFSGTIKLMTLVSLSQLEVGVEDTGIGVLADTLLREWKWVGFLYMYPFALHNLIFYLLLLNSRLIPRAISLAGLLATILILVNIFSAFSISHTVGLYYSPPLV
ncbi:MAG: DUF4386 domain-containing protein [Bacteroidota bacterium]